MEAIDLAKPPLANPKRPPTNGTCLLGRLELDLLILLILRPPEASHDTLLQREQTNSSEEMSAREGGTFRENPRPRQGTGKTRNQYYV